MVINNEVEFTGFSFRVYSELSPLPNAALFDIISINRYDVVNTTCKLQSIYACIYIWVIEMFHWNFEGC